MTCHAAGCPSPVLYELLTFDRRPFPTPLFGCDVASRIHGLAHCRRLPASRSATEPVPPLGPVAEPAAATSESGPQTSTRSGAVDGAGPRTTAATEARSRPPRPVCERCGIRVEWSSHRKGPARWCRPCYFQVRKGEPFDAHVDRSRGLWACWPWTGRVDADGYGKFGRSNRTHRFAYERERGPIPDGLHVLHSCDNPTCVNPAHLHLGTIADNNREMVARGRNRSGRTPYHTRPRAQREAAAVISGRAGKGSRPAGTRP